MAESGTETWVPVCGSGAVLYYNDPITRTWKPVCSSDDPVYGVVNGAWMPLCCGLERTPLPPP